MNPHASSFCSLFPKIFPLVVAACIALSCGSNPSNNRQLQSISVSPASASPQSGNTTVQFTATGVYTAAPTPVTPLQANWAAVIPSGGPTTAVTIDANGLAQCTPAASGVYSIGAWDLMDPTLKATCASIDVYGAPGCNAVLATAQLTCP